MATNKEKGNKNKSCDMKTVVQVNIENVISFCDNRKNIKIQCQDEEKDKHQQVMGGIVWEG